MRAASLHSLHPIGDEGALDDDRPTTPLVKSSEAAELLKGPAVLVDESVRLDYARPTMPERTRALRARYRRFRDEQPLLVAGLTGALLFVVSFFGLIILLKILLPPLDADHAPKVKIPKSFDQLKDLNEVLHIYTERNFFRVLSSFCAVYLMLQAYSLPGSMYMSILGGSLYGWVNIILCCSLVATGATLCYAISALLGPALLAVSHKWQLRVANWQAKLEAQGANLFSYLVVIRIAPLPPHWVVNVLAPHLGVGVPLFWTSTWAGIFGVTTIHTSIGRALDDMTSPEDFHIISVKNALGLGAVIFAVLVPVFLRRKYSNEVADAAAVDAAQGIALPVEADEALLPASRTAALREARLIFLRDDGRVDERRVPVVRGL